MSKIVFLGYVFNDNYMEKIRAEEFNILLFLIPASYLILFLLEKHYKSITKFIIVEEEYNNKKVFCLVAFIFLLIIYLVYYFSFYPGGVYIDTWTSLEMITGKIEFSTQQPILYTISLSIVKAFLPDVYTGFGVFTFIQIIIMISAIVYFLNWLLKKKVNPIIVYIITFFYGLFRLYPFYSISIWKDTPFSLALFMYSLFVTDLVIDIKNKKINTFTMVNLSVFSVLVIFLRSNGIYIVTITSIIIVIMLLKDLIQAKRISNTAILFITLPSVIMISIAIQNVIFVIGIKKAPQTEMLSIPLQQIARVVANDGNVSDEQKDLIGKVLPIETVKEKYKEMLVDDIKWDKDFNEEYLYSHMDEYTDLWLEIGKQNPDKYFEAFLLETSGFWTFNVKGKEAYISAEVWETLNDKIKNIDLIAENSNFTFKNDILSVPLYSGGFFAWIMLLSMFIAFRICKKGAMIGYLPEFLLWLTVMTATPMGQALRYVYILVLLVPFNIIYPAMIKNNCHEE